LEKIFFNNYIINNMDKSIANKKNLI